MKKIVIICLFACFFHTGFSQASGTNGFSKYENANVSN